jgi:Flp pilus assembly protein TadD
MPTASDLFEHETMPTVDKDKLQKFRAGEIRFSQIFGLKANHIASLLLCGHNFFSQGRMEEARTIFEGLAVLDPTNPYVHTMLGAMHQHAKRNEAAILRYNRAIELFPEDLTARTNRAEVHLSMGKFVDAANDLKKVIELDPERKNPATQRARLLAAMTAESLRLAKAKGTKAILAGQNPKPSA